MVKRMKQSVKKWLSALLAAAMILSAGAVSVGAEPVARDDEELAMTAKGNQPAVSAAALDFDNTADGTCIRWNACDGAESYALYLFENDAWLLLAQTEGLEFTHNPLENQAEYRYRIMAFDGEGQEIEGYTAEAANIFFAPPEITALSGVSGGVRIEWNALAGAPRYRVFRKTGSSDWDDLAETIENAYVDTTAASGARYTYTVRIVSADSERYLSDLSKEKSLDYIATPTISSIENTLTGAKISWQMPKGAVKCRVFYKNGNSWKCLTETAGSSYVHDKLTAGQRYVYTIRCVNEKGGFVSDYNRDGWENTFIAPPVITSLTNTDQGVLIKWSAGKGAENYRVYCNSSKGWTKLGETASTSYLHTGVSSGNTYTYTVRCISADGTRFASAHNSGKKTQYIGVPTISSIENTQTGAKISWQMPKGAVKCRVFYKNGSSWKCLTETAGSSYVHDKLTAGQRYVYTIRCVNEKGGFVSDYNRDGWENTFIAPPVITSLTNTDQGALIKWNAEKGAASYRIYRKGFKASWGRIADSVVGTSYTDTTAAKDTLYAYTVRCLDENGSFVSGYYDSDTYYYNGKLASGSITVNGSKLKFENGKVRMGYQTINGKTYYYSSNGQIQKNGIVGNATDGYCYADKNGVIDFGYCNGVTFGGADWNVIEGKATKVSSASDRTLFRALKWVNRVTNSSMTKAQKLRACFNYLKTAGINEKNPRIPHYTGMDWPIIYANDIFLNKEGNCMSFGAAFAYMAKGIGCKNAYACNSGGHGWAEVDGLVYDPEWSIHHSEYSYYGVAPGDPCDVHYWRAISAGAPWMHIKV